MKSRIPSIEELSGQVIVKEACQAEAEVSVVTVCLNPLKAGRSEVFKMNLDSVQAQEGICLEHLIIDGASTDGTLDWLKDYDNKRYNIRILSKPDDGIYEAMNRGIALSRGKYIIFLNSDDYFNNATGMAVSAKRIEELQCEFSFAPIHFSGSSGSHNPQLAPQRRLHRFLISWCFSHQSMLTSRSLLQRIDGFDTSYRSASDYDLLFRLIEAGAKGCFVPLPFATFTIGGFSALQENAQLIKEECIRSLQSFYEQFYATELTYREAEHIFNCRVFPRKHLKLYKQTQQLIRERFIGTPKGLVSWFSQRFNYIKYYLKCLSTNI